MQKNTNSNIAGIPVPARPGLAWWHGGAARLARYAVLCLLCTPGSGLAAQISAMTWVGNSDVLALHIDEHPEYELQTPDQQTIHLILKNTRAVGAIPGIEARSLVKSGALVISGNDAILKLNLTVAGQATLIPSPDGYNLAVKPVGQAAASEEEESVPAQAVGKTALTQVAFSRLHGDQVQIDLTLDGAVPEPSAFRTLDPPRLALDFVGLTNRSGRQLHPVRIAAVDSLVLVEDDARLRLVLNLQNPVDYRLKKTAQGIAVTVSPIGGLVEAPAVATPEPVAAPDRAEPVETAAQPAVRAPVAQLPYSIEGIDFRRTPDGSGRVIVKLSSDEVAVDLSQQGGDIIVLLPNTSLPSELEQRLDVVDFATPVSIVESYADGNNAKLVITPSGRFKQSSIQSGSSLIIDVAPLTELEEQADKLDEFGFSGERLSFNFQRISTRAALQVIADFTGLNFVTSDAVDGDLSLRLNDVPWDQALEVILQTKGLAMRQKGNVVWVAPAEEIQAKEKLALEARQEVSDIEPLVSELIKISYADAEDIADILKSIKAVETGINTAAFSTVSVNEIKTEENNLLSDRGSVSVDTRTNSLLIQDTPSKLREIRELITKLDIPVRQIQIETRIVQASDNFGKSLGARLGFTRVAQKGRVGGVFGSGSVENTNRVRTDGVDEFNNDSLSVNLGADSVESQSPGRYAFTLAKLGSGYLNLLDLEISALQAEGEGRLLANPKILTTDKNQASIERGQERTQILAGGLTGATTGTQKAVLNLTVTPQITPDDRVVLDVQITNDEFADASNGLLNTNRISTKILLENGETVVIGGIYSQDQAKDVAKVPLLGDLPGLGYLFRKKTSRNNRTELLVFLTPKIINPALAVQ